MKYPEWIQIVTGECVEFVRGIRKWARCWQQWCATKKTAIRTLLSMDIGELARQAFLEMRQAGNTRNQLGNIKAWPRWFRAVLLSAVFLLVLGVSATVFWGGLLDESRALASDTSMQKIRYQRMAYEVSMLDLRTERINAIEARFGQMLELIPADLEVVHVLDQVNSVARESGMTLQSFKPDREIIDESYATLPVSIELSGTFESVGRFLEALSRLKHLVTMDMLLESRDSGPGRLYLIAKLKAYRGEITKGNANARNTNRGSNEQR